MIVTILSDTLAEKLQLLAEREGCTPEEILHMTLERSLSEEKREGNDDKDDDDDDPARPPATFRRLISRIDLQTQSSPVEIAPDLRRLIDESA